MSHAGRDIVADPSDTEIRTCENTPTSASVGVPEIVPVVESNVAQDGRFETAKVSRSPSGSLAEGTNEYESPILTAVCGLPEMVGGLFCAPGASPPAADWDSSLLKHPPMANAHNRMIVDIVFLAVPCVIPLPSVDSISTSGQLAIAIERPSKVPVGSFNGSGEVILGYSIRAGSPARRQDSMNSSLVSGGPAVLGIFP